MPQDRRSSRDYPRADGQSLDASAVSASEPSATATDFGSSATATPEAPASSTDVDLNARSLTNFKGIVYSPYKGNYGSTSCKTAADVMQDFQKISINDYNLIRLYGVDCNQVANVAAAAKAKGMKLFLGIYNIANGAYNADLASMASQLKNDWSNVHTVSVGNELVNAGVQPSEVLSALKSVKAQMKGKGPKVVTVDTFTAVIANPALCQESDYTAVNMHPFFDPLTVAVTAGTFITTQMENVRNACPKGQDIIITETGWPSHGQQLNLAVPGPWRQKLAIRNIKRALPTGYILLSAFNDYWKAPGPYDVENYFGLYGKSPSDCATT